MSGEIYWECSKKKCKWVGTESEKSERANKDHPGLVTDHVCPRCGNESFYELEGKKLEKYLTNKDKQYFGKDCPEGMVQVEFVGCGQENKISDYGWKPVKHAFIDLWVDGKRFRIEIGDIEGSDKRGLKITSDFIDMEVEKTAVNSINVSLNKTKP